MIGRKKPGEAVFVDDGVMVTMVVFLQHTVLQIKTVATGRGEGGGG